jgi:tetratricopeptide (TPR) repeat protein
MGAFRLARALTALLIFAPTVALADDRALCEHPGSRRDAAIEACNRVLSAGGLDDRATASILVRRGLHYGVLDRDKAVEDLNDAIALKPDLALAWWGRAYFNERSRDLRKDPELRQRIIADYSKAIELAPDSAEYYYHRGLIYSGYERDYARAIADYSSMIALRPSHAAAYLARANAYRNLGDVQRQIADLTEIVRINHNADAYINRGMAHLSLKDHDSAFADLTEAQRLAPYHPSPLSGLAVIHAARGDYAQALVLYDQAVKQAPHLPWVYGGRARIYLRMGEHQKALADAERALAMMRIASALNLRAEIYEAMGRNDDAAADFRAALALNHGAEADTVSRAGLDRLGLRQ